jgi:hypothetical protein
MTIHDVIQRSPEWRALRAGRLCGSDAADAFKTNKDGKFAASRRNIAMQLVLERITGRVQESGFVTQAMQDGTGGVLRADQTDRLHGGVCEP